MTKIRMAALLPLLLLNLAAPAQYGPQPPFTIEIEPVVTQNPLPGLHSFAFAKSGSRWLFAGGRINGLHGFSTNENFAVEYANGNIVVIDTASWQYYTSPLSVLPQNISDALSSTNMQYAHDGDYLYMIGGFGWDSTQSAFLTYNTITALHVNNIISAVMSGNPIAPHIRQIADNNLRVCGGELQKLNGNFYLLFGHDFTGVYSDPPIPTFTQTYTNAIKRFSIADDGVTMSITNYSALIDTNNFHRRDLNAGPIIFPNGNFGLEAYSGVFRKDVNWPYTWPITYDGMTATVDSSFDQNFNNYTCPLLPVFDSLNGTMYTTFFGGIGLYDFDPQSGLPVFDSLVPFVSDVSCVIRDAYGAHAQGVLPQSMPGLLGSNAKFVLNDAAPHYANEVLRLRDLPGRTLAGYIVGGIRSTAANLAPQSFAHDTVYRVYITPDQILLSDKSTGAPEFLRLFPNPANDRLFLRIKTGKAGALRVKISDMQGRLLREEKFSDSGAQQDFLLSTRELAAGYYFIQVEGNHFSLVEKIGITR